MEKQSSKYKNGAKFCTWPWTDIQDHLKGKQKLKDDKHGTFLNYKTVLHFQYHVCLYIEKSWKINSKVGAGTPGVRVLRLGWKIKENFSLIYTVSDG